MSKDDLLYASIQKLAREVRGRWQDYAQRLLGQADCWMRSIRSNGHDLATNEVRGDTGDCSEAASRGVTDQLKIRFAGTQMTQIEYALERMESRLYHLCETCGRDILPERREAFPEATRCVGCQQIHDSAKKKVHSR